MKNKKKKVKWKKNALLGTHAMAHPFAKFAQLVRCEQVILAAKRLLQGLPFAFHLRTKKACRDVIISKMNDFNNYWLPGNAEQYAS